MTKKVQDKYAWDLSRLPLDKKLDLAQKGFWSIIARIVGAIDKKYGQEGLDTIRNALRTWDINEQLVSRSGLPVGKIGVGDFLCKVADSQD